MICGTSWLRASRRLGARCPKGRCVMADPLHLKWGWIPWALIAAAAGAVCGVASLPIRG